MGRRKVHFAAFFWSVVLGFGVSKDRSLADMRRRYEGSTSSTIEESSYYDRFTRALVAVLKGAMERGLDHLVATTKRELESTWSSFRDLLLVDATEIRLHDLLQKTYRACRTNHTKAAAKMHVVLSVVGHSRNQVQLTSERVHDSSLTPADVAMTYRLRWQIELLFKEFPAQARALRPLADRTPFQSLREVQRQIWGDGCVELDTNWYSVPTEHWGIDRLADSR